MRQVSKVRALCVYSGVAIVAVLAMASGAQAKDFASLSASGYKAGALSKNKAGAWGWKVSNGKESYFCKMNVALAYVGKDGMTSFTSSGRQVKLDRKVYESSMGGHDSTLPQMEDLKAGKPRLQDVGSCVAVK